MKIFVDSASLSDIETYLDWGICDGVTTNPSIHVAAGIGSYGELRDRNIQIAKLIYPRPLSVEVCTDEMDEMIREAKEYVSWADNINVKITITTQTGESCLPVVHRLCEDGIDVNVTAMMTANQAMLASKAGAKYVSLFGGRIDDEGGDATSTISSVRAWLDLWGTDCPRSPEIIVGSSRTTKNISDWSESGAHILTVTPPVLARMLLNARTKETVTQFLKDAKQALGQITV